MAEVPLTRKDLKFVDGFRRYRDIYRAAEFAKVAKSWAKRTYDRIEIGEEIERQDGVVERQRALTQVEGEGITRNFLDTRLLQLINLDVKKHAGIVKGALELGYVRAGVMQVGNTRSLDLTPPNPDEDAPVATVYQAFFTGSATITAAPLVPPSEPAGPSDEEFRRRVRELTTPKVLPQPVPAAIPEPVAATPKPVPAKVGVIKAGRIKIGG